MRLGKRAAAAMLLALWCLLLAGCEAYQPAGTSDVVSLDELPPYSGEPYVEINGNEPAFLPGEMTANSYEVYSPLDELGRCGEASACVGVDLMPTEERGSIGQVKPTGWQTVKYDCVDGKYLYNRCHLIGYQLSGENANKQNLITGTRYLNVEGMLPFENLVADYVKETENHVLYRVCPVYDGGNLVASGVTMEAKSVEDDGGGGDRLRHRRELAGGRDPPGGRPGDCLRAQYQLQEVPSARLLRREQHEGREPPGDVLLPSGAAGSGL